jgi:hypothetical protein
MGSLGSLGQDMQGLSDTRDTSRETGAIRPWLPAAAVGLVALSMSVAVEARPRDPAQAAAIFPPWWNAASVIDAASRAGSVVAVGAMPFVVTVRTADGPVAPRLRAVGAWFSIDPGLARSCGA